MGTEIKINDRTLVADINIAKFLHSNARKMESILPKHLTVQRLSRIAITELSNNEALKVCTVKSFFGAITKCATLGMEPGDALGQAYLIPYGAKCQFILGYKGMMELARRAGIILSITAKCVYKEDYFRLEYGINEKLRHIPKPQDRDDKNIVRAYVIAKTKDGGIQIEDMFVDEINKIRASSPSKNSVPWTKHYGEMAKKTVIRRGSKYWPMSIEFAEALANDDAGEHGLQDNSSVFEGDFEVVSVDEKKPEQKIETKSERMANKFSERKQGSAPSEMEISKKESLDETLGRLADEIKNPLPSEKMTSEQQDFLKEYDSN